MARKLYKNTRARRTYYIKIMGTNALAASSHLSSTSTRQHPRFHLRRAAKTHSSSSLYRPCRGTFHRGRIFCASDDDENNNNNNNKENNNVLSFLCPLLKLIGGGDAAKPRNRTLEVATSGFASIARIQYGKTVLEECIQRRKQQPKLILCEIRGVPVLPSRERNTLDVRFRLRDTTVSERRSI